MDKIKFKYLAGFAICAVVLSAAFALLNDTIDLEGKKVPNGLSELVNQSQQPDFVVPEQFAATCLPAEQVTDDTLKDIKTVTGKDAEDCSYKDDSFHGDAIFGAIAFMVVCGLGFWVYKLNSDNKQVAFAIAVAMGVGGVFLGGYFDNRIDDWFTNNNIVGDVFWRGAGAMLVMTVGGFWAYHVHAKQDQDADTVSARIAAVSPAPTS